MDLSNFQGVLQTQGQQVLQAAMALYPLERDFLAHFQDLSRRYAPETARAALEIAILRGEAPSKFPRAEQMYFTRAALQQASGHIISAYRARRYRGYSRIIDLGCSIGGDTLAFARVAPTLGLDIDPLRLAMAQANCTALGVTAAFLQADLTQPPPFAARPQTGLFFDPARRDGHRRIFSVRGYQPPLDIVLGWRPNFPALGVKISPGVQLDELQNYDCEIEFISVRGELKEAVLWFGPFQSARYRATLLPGGQTATPANWPDICDQTSKPRRYIYEPDPAILRAGLVQNLAARLNAFQLDPEIAYLTADALNQTPFARTWEIEDWFPFQLKKLRAYLRDRNVGQVVVKKRGSPLQPEKLIRDLRLNGTEERVVFLTHLRGKPIVIVGFNN